MKLNVLNPKDFEEDDICLTESKYFSKKGILLFQNEGLYCSIRSHESLFRKQRRMSQKEHSAVSYVTIKLIRKIGSKAVKND